MSFSKILGDSESAAQLQALSDSRRLPHAVIFEGLDSSLLSAAAHEISASFLCESEGERPCRKCSACRKVFKDIHPDVYIASAIGGKQAIGVGEIREMISDCYIKPNEASGKVYCIMNKMTPEAQNALLKSLEEPPQNVLFVILTEKSTLLLKTVLSRAVLFKLSSPKDSNIPPEATEIAVEIVKAIPKNIELPLLAATSRLLQGRDITKQTLDQLSEFFTMALEEKYLGEAGYPDYITEMSRVLKRSSIVKLFDVTAQARDMLEHNCNMNILVTWLCANIRISRH